MTASSVAAEQGANELTSELSGTSALVTGGTSGIGRAIAVELARMGAHVALSGRDADRGSQVVRQIEAAGGQAEFLAADLSDAASARSLAERAIELLGRVDVLVNNAGRKSPKRSRSSPPTVRVSFTARSCPLTAG